ncbi:transposase, partial [Coleofasciculus sp.]|uniref:transposase n=1 Tax=Coleofasciculus sp. TaxID=3100458 RepID=UPI0039F91FB6
LPCPDVSDKYLPCPDVSDKYLPCPDISDAHQTLSKNVSPHLDESTAQPKGTKSGSLGAIIQNFKSVSTRKINRMNGTSGAIIWQSNYYEHIIRDQRSLNHIRNYITENPQRWTEDIENRGIYYGNNIF